VCVCVCVCGVGVCGVWCVVCVCGVVCVCVCGVFACGLFVWCVCVCVLYIEPNSTIMCFQPIFNDVKQRNIFSSKELNKDTCIIK